MPKGSFEIPCSRRANNQYGWISSTQRNCLLNTITYRDKCARKGSGNEEMSKYETGDLRPTRYGGSLLLYSTSDENSICICKFDLTTYR